MYRDRERESGDGMAVIVVESFSHIIGGLPAPKRTYTSPNWKPTGGHEKISRSLPYKLCAMYIMLLHDVCPLQPAHNRTRFYVVYFISFFSPRAPLRGTCSAQSRRKSRADIEIILLCLLQTAEAVPFLLYRASGNRGIPPAERHVLRF